MADRPIIFSAPMVRALLAGTKTQTRRALNPQPPEGARYSGIHFASDEPASYFFNSPAGPFKVRQRIAEDDRLWVREAWRTFSSFDDEPPRNLDFVRVWYEADAGGYKPKIRYRHGRGRYRHGRFMPRWFSRLTLTVTAVCVERLQDISEADALAEGVEGVIHPVAGRDVCTDGEYWPGGPQRMYRELWNAINGPGSWEANPWVAAYTFTVAQQNIDAGAKP